MTRSAKVFLSSILFGLLFLNIQSAFAGGCQIIEVTQSKALLSSHMYNLVRNKVIDIEKAMSKRGENGLQVVMIARKGEILDSFRVVKDDVQKPLQDHLNMLANISLIRTTDEFILPRKYSVPNNIVYSHFGFLLKRSPIIKEKTNKEEDEDWSHVTHLLAKCDEGGSNRYTESKIFFARSDEFYWDTEFVDDSHPADRSLIIVPAISLQKQLFEIINRRDLGRSNLHTGQYNVASVPFVLSKSPGASDYHQLRDQNSNQWPLELLAAAQRPTGEIKTRAQAQDILWNTNYRPSLLAPNVASFKGAIYSVACTSYKMNFGKVALWDASNLINCDDQIYRKDGVLQIITVNSIVDYLLRTNLLAKSVDNVNEGGVYEVVIPKEKIRDIDLAGKVFQKIYGNRKATSIVAP